MFIISIIVPCYNQGKYLDKCLSSVLSQDVNEWECIIINDGSTDDTESIAQKWVKTDSRFKYIYQKNGGLSDARNTGINAATGSHVFFLDGDDSLASNRSIFYLSDCLTPTTDIVCGQVDYEYDHITKPAKINIRPKSNILFLDEKILPAYFEQKISVIACNKLFSLDLIRKHNLTFKKGLKHEDELWSLQIFSLAKRIMLAPETTYNYYQGNINSITKTKSLSNFKSIIYILSFLVKEATNNPLYKHVETELIVKKFRSLSGFLSRSELINDRNNWISFYTEVQSIYQTSILYSNQQLFSLPAGKAHNIARFLKYSANRNIIGKVINKIKYHLWRRII